MILLSRNGLATTYKDKAVAQHVKSAAQNSKLRRYFITQPRESFILVRTLK